MPLVLDSKSMYFSLDFEEFSTTKKGGLKANLSGIPWQGYAAYTGGCQ